MCGVILTNFSDKIASKKIVVWITGSGSGLGREMAVCYGKQRAVVILSGRRAERLSETAEAVTAAGGMAVVAPCDVTDLSTLVQVVDMVEARFGRLDVVIANAGTAVSGTVAKLSAEQWNRQYAVNVFGVAHTIASAMPMIRASRGRIAVVSSVAAVSPMTGTAAYQSSKAAVAAVAQSLVVEVAGTGVSVTTIFPGYVESEIGRVDEHGHFDEQHRDNRPASLMWKTEKAADVMVRGINKRRRTVVFTAHGRIAFFVGRHFPFLMEWLMRIAARRTRYHR
jgi:NAD(P)-dependent dehydrogenase (short-subunit alcohol dehydrogenase family)